MTLRQTHTFALLEVSAAAYDEIAKKLRDAGYGHAFVDENIDMHGIALTRKPSPLDTETPLLSKLRRKGG